jgi:hypothetical protein
MLPQSFIPTQVQLPRVQSYGIAVPVTTGGAALLPGDSPGLTGAGMKRSCGLWPNADGMLLPAIRLSNRADMTVHRLVALMFCLLPP